MFGITHLDVMPLFYGVVIFIGIWSLISKLRRGRLLAFLLEAGTWWLVFSLHGGTMTGGFAAAVSALLVGLILTRMLKI